MLEKAILQAAYPQVLYKIADTAHLSLNYQILPEEATLPCKIVGQSNLFHHDPSSTVGPLQN